MTEEEIIRELEANINRTVRIRFTDGHTCLVTVRNLDAEGFVSSVDSPRDKQRSPALTPVTINAATEETKGIFWTTFEDVLEVESKLECAE